MSCLQNENKKKDDEIFKTKLGNSKCTLWPVQHGINVERSLLVLLPYKYSFESISHPTQT